jgi:diguanylate cyclase (GGDEF)-like protein
MSEPFGSKLGQSATALPHPAGAPQKGAEQSPGRVSLTLAGLAALFVCAFHAAAVRVDTPRAAGFGYLCFTLAYFLCAAAFRVRARFAQGTLRIRWILISTAALAAGIAYEPSFNEGVLHAAPSRLLSTACFNASEALCMLAAVLFFAGVGRSIVFVDMLQALLFVVLRFNLIYSRVTLDHFTVNHLIVGQIVALLMFLVALVACLGAASRDELSFLRALTMFFGVRLAGLFLGDQVSYSWLHYTCCSEWDVIGTALLAGFAVYLLFTSRAAREQSDTAPLASPSVTVRSLMPSLLALVNLVLGLFLLRISLRVAVVAISGSLVCYVVRTVLLHAQSMKDHALLQSRNEHLEGLAVRDHLTGIGNRRSLAGIYGGLHALAPLTGVSLLVMDIDHFKLANDSNGHGYGDQVLITLARKLESLAATLPGSHCARLGGDEFALLLPGVTLQSASVQGEKLRILFSATSSDAENSPVSLSVGVASLHAVRDMPLETLVSYADEALYRAKLLGRNRVEVQPVWEPESPASEPATPALQLETQESAS